MMNSNTVQWSEKINISNRLADYVQHKGSQKKASVSLNISNATISQILGSKWESISDEMWRRVSSGVGGGANEWVMVTDVSVTNKIGRASCRERGYEVGVRREVDRRRVHSA